MFLDFFYLLRARGLPVTLNEWMTLMEALDMGLAQASLTRFYHLCRSVLIKSESDFDKFDQVFMEYFRGIETPEQLPKEFWDWLAHGELERALDDLGGSRNRRKNTTAETTGSAPAAHRPWAGEVTIPPASG